MVRPADRARWRNQQTREAQNLEPETGVGVQVSPWSLQDARWTGVRIPARSHKPHDVGSNPTLATLLVRMDECPAGSHKPSGQVRLLNPQLGRWDRHPAGRTTRWWKRQTHEAENLGPGAGVGVRVSPWLLLGPVVQRRRPLAYTQETMVRVHPGSLVWGRWSKGKTPASQVGNRSSTLRRSI